MRNIEELLSRQLDNLQAELNLLKPVLARKTEDLDRLEKSASKEIRELQARNQELAARVNELKDDHDRSKSKSSTVIAPLLRNSMSSERSTT